MFVSGTAVITVIILYIRDKTREVDSESVTATRLLVILVDLDVWQQNQESSESEREILYGISRVEKSCRTPTTWTKKCVLPFFVVSQYTFLEGRFLPSTELECNNSRGYLQVVYSYSFCVTSSITLSMSFFFCSQQQEELMTDDHDEVNKECMRSKVVQYYLYLKRREFVRVNVTFHFKPLLCTVCSSRE